MNPQPTLQTLLDSLTEFRTETNERFEQVEKRFEQVEKQLVEFRVETNKQFEQVEKQMDLNNRKLEVLNDEMLDLKAETRLNRKKQEELQQLVVTLVPTGTIK